MVNARILFIVESGYLRHDNPRNLLVNPGPMGFVTLVDWGPLK